jgi:hypothetical protein
VLPQSTRRCTHLWRDSALVPRDIANQCGQESLGTTSSLGRQTARLKHFSCGRSAARTRVLASSTLSRGALLDVCWSVSRDRTGVSPPLRIYPAGRGARAGEAPGGTRQRPEPGLFRFPMAGSPAPGEAGFRNPPVAPLRVTRVPVSDRRRNVRISDKHACGAHLAPFPGMTAILSGRLSYVYARPSTIGDSGATC